MIRLSLALSLLASTAQADAFCDALADLASTGNAPSLTLPETDLKAQCKTSLMLGGGSQVHCGWTFAYRASAAQDAFADVTNAVKDCLGSSAQATQDQDVNHPDFYDLQTFTTADRTVSVSLKDKGALQQTLVFVRIEQR